MAIGSGSTLPLLMIEFDKRKCGWCRQGDNRRKRDENTEKGAFHHIIEAFQPFIIDYWIIIELGSKFTTTSLHASYFSGGKPLKGTDFSTARRAPPAIVRRAASEPPVACTSRSPTILPSRSSCMEILTRTSPASAIPARTDQLFWICPRNASISLCESVLPVVVFFVAQRRRVGRALCAAAGRIRLVQESGHFVGIEIAFIGGRSLLRFLLGFLLLAVRRLCGLGLRLDLGLGHRRRDLVGQRFGFRVLGRLLFRGRLLGLRLRLDLFLGCRQSRDFRRGLGCRLLLGLFLYLFLHGIRRRQSLLRLFRCGGRLPYWQALHPGSAASSDRRRCRRHFRHSRPCPDAWSASAMTSRPSALPSRPAAICVSSSTGTISTGSASLSMTSKASGLPSDTSAQVRTSACRTADVTRLVFIARALLVLLRQRNEADILEAGVLDARHHLRRSRRKAPLHRRARRCARYSRSWRSPRAWPRSHPAGSAVSCRKISPLAGLTETRDRLRFGIQRLGLGFRQVDRHADRHHRRGDHEDDQEHQHDVDERRHVDLAHGAPCRRGPAGDVRRQSPSIRPLPYPWYLLRVPGDPCCNYCAAWRGCSFSSIWRERMAENSSAKPSMRAVSLPASAENLL